MTRLHVTPRLRMSGHMPVRPHMPSWRVKRRIYRYHSMSILVSILETGHDRFLPPTFLIYYKQPSPFHSMPSNFNSRRASSSNMRTNNCIYAQRDIHSSQGLTNHRCDGSRTSKTIPKCFKYSINLKRSARVPSWYTY